MDDEISLAGVLNGCLIVSQLGHLFSQPALLHRRAKLKSHGCAAGKIGSQSQRSPELYLRDNQGGNSDNHKYTGNQEKPPLLTNKVYHLVFLTVWSDVTP